MAYSYDRRVALDSSILGITESQLEAMDQEERLDFLVGLLHQAGDLAEELLKPFSKDLGPHANDVRAAAKLLQKVARQLPHGR